MEPAARKNSHYPQNSPCEVVEREPLVLGLMFLQGQGAWTASLIPIETSIEKNNQQEMHHEHTDDSRPNSR
jgi:hypothetical protein